MEMGWIFFLMSSSLYEALQATNMTACSTTNLFFLSHTSSIFKSSSSSSSMMITSTGLPSVNPSLELHTAKLYSNSEEQQSSPTKEEQLSLQLEEEGESKVTILSNSNTNTNTNTNTAQSTIQDVYLIDLSTSCIEEDAVRRESEMAEMVAPLSYQHPLRWNVFSFSFPCLSSLLSTPVRFPRSQLVWRYPHRVYHLMVKGDDQIADVDCVDVQHLTMSSSSSSIEIGEEKKERREEEEEKEDKKKTEKKEMKEEKREDKKGKKGKKGKKEEEEVEVIDKRENLVMSKKGVRMIYMATTENSTSTPSTTSPGSKKQRRKSCEIASSSQPSEESLQIISFLSQHPTLVLTLLHTPFFLVCSDSPLFTQLMRSLLLARKLAQVTVENLRALLLPCTATTAYLFFPAGKEKASNLAGFQEKDCQKILCENQSADLTYFWRHLLNEMSSKSDEKEVPISGIQPGDLYSYNLLRRQNPLRESPENDDCEEIAKLRSKLTSRQIKEMRGERRTTIGDLGVILKSQLEEE